MELCPLKCKSIRSNGHFQSALRYLIALSMQLVFLPSTTQTNLELNYGIFGLIFSHMKKVKGKMDTTLTFMQHILEQKKGSAKHRHFTLYLWFYHCVMGSIVKLYGVSFFERWTTSVLFATVTGNSCYAAKKGKM